MNLHEQLNCVGYFGFGSGWNLHHIFAGDGFPVEIYCDSCPIMQECWKQHQERTRQMFPDITKLCDEIAKTHSGADYIKEFIRRTNQGEKSFVEPFLCTMAGNLEDGSRIGGGMQPRDRGKYTIAFPFTVN